MCQFMWPFILIVVELEKYIGIQCVPKQLAACFELTSKQTEWHNSSHGNFAGIQLHVVNNP